MYLRTFLARFAYIIVVRKLRKPMNKLKLLLVLFPVVFFYCEREFDYGNSELFEKIDLTDINILKEDRENLTMTP